MPGIDVKIARVDYILDKRNQILESSTHYLVYGFSNRMIYICCSSSPYKHWLSPVSQPIAQGFFNPLPSGARSSSTAVFLLPQASRRTAFETGIHCGECAFVCIGSF